jgi:hypothetical protein
MFSDHKPYGKLIELGLSRGPQYYGERSGLSGDGLAGFPEAKRLADKLRGSPTP